MEQEHFSGSWERNGRSITAAAVIGLIGIGVFYFYMQSIVAAAAVLVANGLGLDGAEIDGKVLSDESVAILRAVVFSTQYLFMLLPSWYLIRRLHTGNVGAYVRLNNFSLYQGILAVIGTVSLIPLSLLFSTFLTESLGIPDHYSDESTAFFTSYTPAEFAWLIAGVAVTPALCEEVFFRGHVQRTLERTMSIHSIWIVGLLFGLFHFQPLGLASLSLLGLYFGYLFYRSRSLFPSMMAHFTNNSIALLIAYQPFIQSQEWIQSIGSEELAVLNLGTLPLAAGTIYLFHRSTSHTAPPGIETMDGGAVVPYTVVREGQRWYINAPEP